MSYINAATYLQHYGSVIGFDDDTVKAIVKTGIDKHFEGVVQLSPIAKSNLEVIATEVPAISKWALDYSLQKVEEVADRHVKDSVEEAIRQFKEDMWALAKRLMPNPITTAVPDFFTYPLMAKIPEQVVIDKMNNITPAEVEALCSIVRNRFVEHHTVVDFKDEKVFLDRVMKGIEARGTELNSLSDFLLKDHLMNPLLGKLIKEKTN